MNFAELIANALSFLLLVTTIYYLHKSIKQIQSQLEIMKEERALNQKDSFYAVWSKLDEILLEHPELTKLWLDSKILQTVQEKYPTSEKQNEFFKHRAFASYVIFLFFRGFQMRKQIKEVLGGKGIEEVSLDNSELKSLWFEGGIRDDFWAYPDYVNFVEKVLLKESDESASD